MKRISAIAVDDEPLALKVIEQHASNVAYVDLKACFTNTADAVAYLSMNEVDVIFLDIKMPDVSGLEMAAMVAGRAQVVFTTAYPDYAVDGFEMNAVDYLLKPVSLLRFVKACERVRQRNETAELPTEVFLKDGGEWIKVTPGKVKYAEAQGNYIRLVTDAGSRLLRMSFSDLIEKLNGNYIRVHKSYMVNPVYIDRIEVHQLTIGADKIPVGASFRKDMLSSLGLDKSL